MSDDFAVSGDRRCADCGVGVAPSQAEDSIHLTHVVGIRAGTVLCGQCLDTFRRNVREARGRAWVNSP